VVGAASRYGTEALKVATTVKLARALWIVPVSLVASYGSAGDGGRRRIRIPYFIGVFIVAILLNSWLPMPRLSQWVVGASHAVLTLTLFLIGSGLSKEVLKAAGLKQLLQGIIIWVLIAGGALWAVIELVG
jgi:uncharacterized membrane protein YadS